MINREWQSVQVLTYSGDVDEYGQLNQGEPTIRNVDMVVKLYSQTNTSDIRYNDVELVGITKDRTITDANEIIINGVKYYILYVIPSSRYYQILMKRY